MTVVISGLRRSAVRSKPSLCGHFHEIWIQVERNRVGGIDCGDATGRACRSPTPWSKEGALRPAPGCRDKPQSVVVARLAPKKRRSCASDYQPEMESCCINVTPVLML